MSQPLSHRIRRAASILVRGEQRPPVRSPIPPLTSGEVDEAKSFFSMPKFFIIGHARSGTTLLARLIRLHPTVHCNWQSHFFTRPPFVTSLANTLEVEDWLTHRANRWNHGSDLSPVVVRAAADFIMERDARRLGKLIVGDKSPTSVIHGDSIRKMHAFYPDASVIYIVRDGRDVAISQRFRNFVEEKSLDAEDRLIRDELRRDPARFRDGEHSLFTERFIRDMARSWQADTAEIPAEGLRLYGSRFATVRYEDLLLRPFDEISRLWQFLGAGSEPDLAQAVDAEISANPDEEWQAQRDTNLAQFLSKGQTGNWRSLFTRRDSKLFDDLAGDMLVKWGYENDRDGRAGT